jgi:hypothetical protein
VVGVGRTLQAGGRAVNHQYSKSMEFEAGFRQVLAGALGGRLAYFSALRPFTELWVARKFAELAQYHATFRSCNRAFHIDPAARLDHWCGRCDKCCFIDLILAPVPAASDLRQIFGGAEPLADPGARRPVPGAARDLGGEQAVRVRGRGRRVPGGGRCSRPGGPTGRTPRSCRHWPPSSSPPGPAHHRSPAPPGRRALDP